MKSRKLTILIVIQHYLPGTKTGGPVRSISNLVEWLGDDFDFRILTYNHDKGDTVPYKGIESGKWYTVGRAQVRYLDSQEGHLLSLAKIIRETPHDLLQLESVLALTSIQALILRRIGLLQSAPILLSVRGHLGKGALQQKSTKKLLFLTVVNLLRLYRGLSWYATSEGEHDEIIQYFGRQEAERIHVIPNLPMRDVQRIQESRPVKRSGSLRIVFLSRIHSIKNLHFALHTLREIQGEIEFDIYGPIEDETYWSECQKIIEHLPGNVQVRYCGVVPFDQVMTVLAQYHLFYLPTLHENYGHVILEALSVGCPVLISDQTPWQDVEVNGAGWALSLDWTNSFSNALNQMLSLDEEQFKDKVKTVQHYRAQVLGVEMIVENLSRVFLEVLSKGPRKPLPLSP